MINEMFLEKIIRKEFGSLTVDELKVIANNVEVFSLNKTNTKILEKIIGKGNLEGDRDKIITVLQEGLPSAFVLLSNLDKYSIKEETVEINFKEELTKTSEFCDGLYDFYRSLTK
jgi:hypothetical protein